MVLGKAQLAKTVLFEITQLNEKHQEFNLFTYFAFTDYIRRPLTELIGINCGR